MLEAEARARISLLVAANEDPVLASEDIDILLDMARRVDVNATLPSGANWTPTFDINYAVSQGWLIKAGKSANKYLFMTGGKMLSRNQIYEHCVAMYKTYAMKAGIKAVRLGPLDDTLQNVPTNVD